GASCLDDIGIHYPNTSPENKYIDSKILLKKTVELIKKENYSVVNIDSTVCLEEPKIKTFTKQMQQIISEIVGVNITDVSIKATTTDQMGFIGKGEGIAAYATVLLEKHS